MRIWIVNPYDPLPGEGVRPGRYWVLAETLVSRGNEVVWWSSSFSHRFKRQREIILLDKVDFQVHLINTNPYYRNISIKRLLNHRQFATGFYKHASFLLNSGVLCPPDRYVISVPPLDTPNAAFRLSSEWGGKVILDIQDAWPETFYRFLPGRREFQRLVGPVVFAPFFLQARKAYLKADALSGVAKTYVDLTKASVHNKPFMVIPLGVDLKNLDKYLPNKKKEPHSPITFIYLGSMSSNYDLKTVVMAAHVLCLEGYKFRILMLGMGPKEEELKSLVSSYELSSVIMFPGFLGFAEMAKLLCQSDIALNTIFPESYIALPNKVADYTGAGLPVINSIPGELEKLLKKYNAGIFYKAGNVKSLYNAMRYYLDNPENIKIQGYNARKLAEELFDRNKIYPSYAQFIETV